jgi:hypothetical protein
MTSKNAILLIVKQNPGIDYNSLFNKFASSYSNVNSARAALSRSLKDLLVLGLISKVDNKFFILEKGEAEIYSELKNKLVLGLNAVINDKKPENQIDFIVGRLQIIIERGRQDKDLLKTARSTLAFSVSDLENIDKNLEKKIRHVEYLSRVFKDQIKTFKEMGFNDKHSRQYSKEALDSLVQIISEIPDNEITVECENLQVIQILSEKFSGKIKNNLFVVSKSSARELIKAIDENISILAGTSVKIFSSLLKAEIFSEKIILSGPFQEILKWRQ